MKKLMLSVIVLISAAACCRDNTVYRRVTVPGPTTVVTQPTPVVPLTDIEQIVADNNEFRVTSGQLPFTRGLTCTLSLTTDQDLSHAIPSAVNTFTLMGTFDQETAPVTQGLNTIPQTLRPLFINGYVMQCSGQLVVTESGYYPFELSSDDASRLFVDNVMVIDNNLNHGPTKVSGAKLLERGVHTVKLQFAEIGAGTEQLILTSSSVVIPAENFYR